MKRITNILLLIPLFVSIGYCQSVLAKTQTIELKAGWNLVALAVEPVDSSSDEIFKSIDDAFIAVWGFDGINRDWNTFPQPLVGASEVTNLEVGKGYWVNVTRSSTLIIESTQELAFGQLNLYPGWNLVGFTTEQPVSYKTILSDVPYSQVWGFNTAANQFEGIVLTSGSDTPIQEDFTQIEPGKAYWIQVDEQVQVGPELATSMPGDVDMSPLLELAEYGEAVPWLNVSQGDEDIGGDGFYDFPNTQRALTFGEIQNQQRISIFNKGTGVLSWNAKIVNPGQTLWLAFDVFNEDEGKNLSQTNSFGQQTQDTHNLQLTADRTQLAPGDYYGQIEITSNGSVGNPSENITAEQQIRMIKVHMNVPDIVGAYDVLVKIDSVNYKGDVKKADMHNPRLYLSISEDNDGVKAIIDEGKTLLIPKRFYLTGNYIKNNANEFALSGSMVLPAREVNAEDEEVQQDNLNPYQVPLQRDITLVGYRSESASLTPMDLEGEYFETVRNVLGEPIYLSGSFTAIRQDANEITTDLLSYSGKSANIPEAPEKLESIIHIDDTLILSDIEITVAIGHASPEDLIVTLTSPMGTSVRLRENSPDSVGTLTYDVNAFALDALTIFHDELVTGDWILTVEDTEATETGRLLGWDLAIQGTTVNSISGILDNLPDGTKILLTGCGQTRITNLHSGYFIFERAIDCVYEITIMHPAYIHSEIQVVLSGSDLNIQAQDLSAVRQFTDTADFTLSPRVGFAPFTIEMTDTTDLTQVAVTNHVWTIFKWTNGQASIVKQLDNESYFEKYKIIEDGIYSVKMDIYDVANGNTLLHSVDKNKEFIIVGQSQGGTSLPPEEQRIISAYTTQGAGGHTGLGAILPMLYANDSATFDIDRPPLNAGQPRFEDSNRFVPFVDDLKQSNALGDNGSLDGAVGDNSYRVFVNIGQPMVGASRSAKYSLSIGPTP